MVYLAQQNPVRVPEAVAVRRTNPERRVPQPGDELLCLDRNGQVVRRFDATRVSAYRLY